MFFVTFKSRIELENEGGDEFIYGIDMIQYFSLFAFFLFFLGLSLIKCFFDLITIFLYCYAMFGLLVLFRTLHANGV